VSIRLGIGSWADDEYRGVLYPPGLPAKDRLRHYATVFDHVEVNSTYYGAPKPDTVRKWIGETPPGFLFDIKLHRVFSMSPRSAQPAEDKRDLLGYTLERLGPLIAAKKLGVFLLLLPARFGPEKHSLAELDTLVERLRPFALAVELRDPAWVQGKTRVATLRAFRERSVALVGVDLPSGPEFFPALDEVTRPDLAYLRLHGRNRAGYLKGGSAEEQHRYQYKAPELEEIAARVRRIAKKASNVRVVCNNHAQDFAPRTALALTKLLGPEAHPAAES
jgi:uncharacterized protein YecE (DUF72 family)